MGKKEKIPLQYSDDLEAIDTALSDAMQHLDASNERVVELLRSCEPPKPEAGAAPGGGAPGTEAPGTEAQTAADAGGAESTGVEGRADGGPDAG